MNQPSRLLSRRAAVRALVLGFALAGAAWAQGGPRDIHFDWPVGTCQDAQLILGRQHYVMREYQTLNTGISDRCRDTHNCYHSGVDISRLDGPANMISQIVYAVADGRVVCPTEWNTQGLGVGIEHPLEDGTTLYSHYVHLNRVFVREGELVRRGQPVGAVLAWPGDDSNSHLHFEIRSRRQVSFLDNGATSTVENCRGNGYSVISRSSGTTGTQLGIWGFLDPTDTFYATRPTFPGAVRTQVQGGATCDNNRQIFSTPDLSSPTAQTLAADQWTRATGVAFEGDGDASDEDEILRGWYRLQGADPAVNEYVLGSAEIGSTIQSAICVGEPFRVGRQWTPPASDPVVDLRFGATDLNGTALTNWAPGGNAAVASGVGLVQPYAITVVRTKLAANAAVPQSCDLAGELSGAGTIEVDPGTANFRGGVAVEALLRLDAVDGERTLAERWETGAEQWRLALSQGALVFTVRQASGRDLTVRYTIPAPRCDMQGSCPNTCDADDVTHPECVLDKGWQQWVHVAAISDPLDRNALELYWDGARKARAQQLVPLAESSAPIRIGEGIDGKLDDVVVWSLDTRNRELDLAFVIDTTGSMWDDLGNVKTASSDIVEALDEASARYRVAVTDFRDHPVRPYGVPGTDYPFRVAQDFASTPGPIVSAINGLSIGNGLDWPESVYSGVMGAIQARRDPFGNRLSGWRHGAEKIVLLIGDAPPHDPEPVTGLTDDDVFFAAIRGGFEIGDPLPATLAAASTDEEERTPVHIYAIVIGGDTAARDSFRLLAEGTGGRLFFATNASQIVQAILTAIGSIGGGGGTPVNNPPDVSGAYPGVSQLWPPNQRMETIAIQNVYDPEGDPLTVTVTGITQDEPVAGPGKPEPDAAGVGTAQARLRAERSGNGHEGRVYRIAFTATDAAGASSDGSILVCVPHDQGPNVACVDDGQAYDSTHP